MAKVLVVDDEEGVLFTLVANLELDGFEVVAASSAAEALDALDAQDVDLVLSDVRMPGMSGVDLLRRIRASGRLVPVVLMTGFALETQLESAIREGAYAVLPKMLPVERLLELVARAIARSVVLVVDDVVAVAESTAAALVELGFRAVAVTGVDDALRVVGSADVDVCVVDLVLEGVDGAETIDRLLAADGRILCIAITGEQAPALVRRAARSAYAVLRKPVPPLDLAATIARARGASVLRAQS